MCSCGKGTSILMKTKRVMALGSLLFLAGLAGQAGAQSLTGMANSKANPLKPASAIRFTLTQRGIQPAEVRVKEGQYLLRFINGEIMGDAAFLVSDSAKGKNGKVSTQKARPHGAAYFDLDAGNYEITVEGHPEWAARLVVEK